MPDEEIRAAGREIRGRVQKACAIVHGRGSGMSANELLELIYEDGLPSRAERERILREKLADELDPKEFRQGETSGGTTPPSPPPPS